MYFCQAFGKKKHVTDDVDENWILIDWLYLLQQESRSSNTSVSRLLFNPTPDVDGKRLICRASNLLLPGTAIEDSWQLRVVCKCF